MNGDENGITPPQENYQLEDNKENQFNTPFIYNDILDTSTNFFKHPLSSNGNSGNRVSESIRKI